jgi:MFS family permease
LGFDSFDKTTITGKRGVCSVSHFGKNRYGSLAVVSLASFLSAYMGSSINVALPLIETDLKLNPVWLGWIATSMLVSTAVFLLPAGRISDSYGRKRIFLIGNIVGFAASLGSILSHSGVTLIGFRILQGAGSAMLFATMAPIVTSAFPHTMKGRVLGINVASVYLGLSAGPFMGGMLADFFGWRSLFIFNLVCAVPVIIYSAAVIDPDKKSDHSTHALDIPGALMYGVSIICGIIGFTMITSVKGMIMFAAGVLVMFFFLRSERRSANPILPVNAFRGNRVFIFSNLAALINYSATAAIAFFMSLYLQYVSGFSPRKAGLVLIVQPLLQSLLSPLAGLLSDTMDPRLLASIGMGIISASLMVLGLYSGVLSLYGIIIILAMLGIGFALFSSPNTNAVLGSVNKRDLGMASSVLSTMRVLGQVMSMGIALLLLNHFIADENITETTVPLFLLAEKSAFIIFSVLCLAGVAASLARGRRIRGTLSDENRQKQ